MPSHDPVSQLVLAYAAERGVLLSDDATVADAWSALHRRGDPTPGLSLADWASPGAIGGPLLPLMANSPDVASVLEQLVDFHPLFGRDRLSVSRAGHRVVLRLEAADGGPASPDTADACFALLARFIRDVSGQGVVPDRVRLRRTPPEDASAYVPLLGRPWFGTDQDACEFDRDTLEAGVRHADPRVLAILRPYAQQRIQEQDRPFATLVADALADTSDGPLPPLAAVAAQMSLSPRAVQQRLAAEATSYREIADTVQRDRVLRWLDLHDLLLATIAVRAGYAESAPLSRAVRRWTGLSPRDYRRRRMTP